jgi:hypothetical protein
MREGGIRSEEFLDCGCLQGWRGLCEQFYDRGDFTDCTMEQFLLVCHGVGAWVYLPGSSMASFVQVQFGSIKLM